MGGSIDPERFLAAFPEAPQARRERAGPLAPALCSLYEDLRADLVTALYWLLQEQLVKEGKCGPDAWKTVLRRAWLATLLLFGYTQREAARELKIGERTAKSDAAAIRVVFPGLRAASTRAWPSLPPIPERDRLRLQRPPARPRRAFWAAVDAGLGSDATRRTSRARSRGHLGD